MSFGSVYPAERANKLKASGTGMMHSRIFSSIEDNGAVSESFMHESELGKALSAHFSKFGDIVTVNTTIETYKEG